jgi:hypothetical protein
MTYPVPARWRHLHPGDMIRERWPITKSKAIAERLRFEGYRFRITADAPEPGVKPSHTIECLDSPKILTKDVP